MEPYTLLLLCTFALTIVAGIGAFIWQLMLSRDQQLNEQAHLKALSKESELLEEVRNQSESKESFKAHYKTLKKNKTSIKYIDEKIDEILKKKFDLVQRYSEMAMDESASVIKGVGSPQKNQDLSVLKKEIDQELEFYESELKTHQARRETLWDTRTEIQTHLVHEETARNEKIDELYEKHTVLLEKIYLGHMTSSEEVNKASIQAGTSSLKDCFSAPIEFFAQFWDPQKKAVRLKNATDELHARINVHKAEEDINNSADIELDLPFEPAF